MSHLPIPESPLEKPKDSPDVSEASKTGAGKVKKHLLLIADKVHGGGVDASLLDTQCAQEILDALCAAYQTAKDKGEDPTAAVISILNIFTEDRGNILTKLFEKYAEDIGKTNLNIKANNETAEIVNWRGKDNKMMVTVFKSGVQKWLAEFARMLPDAHLEQRMQLDELTSSNVTTAMTNAVRFHIENRVQTEPKQASPTSVQSEPPSARSA